MIAVARMISRAVLANHSITIEVYRGITVVFDVTQEVLSAFGTITLLVAGPLCEDFSRKRLLPDFNG